jgi:hypothetical protein
MNLKFKWIFSYNSAFLIGILMYLKSVKSYIFFSFIDAVESGSSSSAALYLQNAFD